MSLLFLIACSILLLHELGEWLVLTLHRDPPPSSSPPLSILICARDEKKALQKNLPQVVDSMRDGDELIVVDDGSRDASFEFLKAKCSEWPLVLVRNHVPQGKKRAVAIGAAKASHPHILQTDADCAPCSPEWVDRMRGGSMGKLKMVLGWSPLEGSKGILGAFLHWESLRTAMNYSFLAGIGLPYMGVGRNLLYEKELRNKSRMPASYHRTLSGDDDLFVAHVRAKGKVRFLTHPASWTSSPPPSSWKGYWHQRRRHAESGLHYPFLIKGVLAILLLAEAIFLITGLALIFFPGERGLAFLLLSALMIIRGVSTLWAAKSFARGALFILTPLFSFMSLMKFIFVDVSVLFIKPTRWR